jgi:hypothetical protein
MIGEICLYSVMKTIVSKSSRVVTFFNGSHYWGGQLQEEAKRYNIRQGLKKNCESRWYALILHCISVERSMLPLRTICIHPEAEKRVGTLSAVNADVRQTILSDPGFWTNLRMLIRIAKPLVDAIGNLEARECNLADCMLELIRCARALANMTVEGNEDENFLDHAKSVFNKRFHRMNTPIHSLALFLHPMCRKLAISSVSGGRTLEFMIQTALMLAKKWNWCQKDALALIQDIKGYFHSKGPFVGAAKDAKEWWTSLTISATDHPIKKLAITIFLIVPHTADVERLFSDLGGVQTPKRCNLTVENFEALGKIRSNLQRTYHEGLKAEGKPIRRHHGHMHTRSEPGINASIVEEEEALTWKSPLSNTAPTSDETGTESEPTDEEITIAFKELEAELDHENDSDDSDDDPADPTGRNVLAGSVYNFKELDKVDKGIPPEGFEQETDVLGSSEPTGWNIAQLMTAAGVAST